MHVAGILMFLAQAVPLSGAAVPAAEAPTAEDHPAEVPAARGATANTPDASSQERPPAKGTLRRSEINGVVKAHLHRIRACYEDRLDVKQDLGGKLVVAWTVSPDGAVRAFAVVEDTFGDVQMADCVTAIVREMRFPKPRGGGDVYVTYPFIFAVSDGAPKSPQRSPESRPRWYFPWTLCR